MALHCTECGFVNAEGANYCQKCGALLELDDAGEPTTATYRVGETDPVVGAGVRDRAGQQSSRCCGREARSASDHPAL